MKKEDIFNAVTDIRSDLIEAAEERRAKRRPWRAVIAACLALVLISGGVLAVFGNAGKSMDRTDESPGASPGDPLTGEPNNGPPDGEATQPQSGTGDGEPAHLITLIEAAYPQAVPYPADGEDTREWSAYQREHRLSAADAAALGSFLDAAVPALLAGTEDKNSVCSPVNVFEALAVLSEIADGETRTQLLDLLGVGDIEDLRSLTSRLVTNLYNDDGAETVRFASSLWLREGMDCDPDTLDTLAESFCASVYAGTPGTNQMNEALRDWLNAQTGGLLKDSVNGVSLDPDTAAAIAATVWFSAKWSRSFIESNNDVRVFRATSGDRETTFMNGVFTMDYYPGDGFIGVELQFRLGGSMRLLLPEEGVTPEELLSKKDALDFLISPDLDGRQGREAEVHLSLPKFDVTGDTDLADALRSLGVTDVFDPGRADLSNLTDEGALWISRVLHSARVTVDETGCEAAAFTYLEAPASSEPSRDPEVIGIVLDRPFLFSVLEEGVPIFTGIVRQP